ncbi:hypothetical protein [Amycolatopsis sp. NPDC058986]|uniref:hypothetical protein n=1 Tax=unclassified Amycolatopsis TaxID=2618356 RepID=UPI00366F532E
MKAQISLQPGDAIRFSDERRSYTVRAVSDDGRWVACTKPFPAQDTVLYTVCDFQENLRGHDNFLLGLGYETDGECRAAIGMFATGEAEFSHRHRPIPFRIVQWRANTHPAAQGAER